LVTARDPRYDARAMRRASVAVGGGFIVAIVAAAWAVSSNAVVSKEPVLCTRFASPAGNDRWRGTRARPYRTVQRLVRSLAGGGGRGCLVPGTYRGNVIIKAGGSRRRPLVLSTLGRKHKAVVQGIVQIDDTANWIVLENLFLDGRKPPTNDGVHIKIFGDHVTLRRNEITSGGERICIQTGDAEGERGIAWHPRIEQNRIHNCGNLAYTSRSLRAYPSGQAIYMQADRHAIVRDNYIYDTNYGGPFGGRGVQLWPDSQNAVVEHNVVDNNNAWNVVVSGSRYPTGSTRDAKIRNNILTRPVEYNLTVTWLGGLEPQPGIEVIGNCVTPGFRGDFALKTWNGRPSYVERDNIRADPGYINREAKDFRTRADSPCKGKGPRPGRRPDPPVGG